MIAWKKCKISDIGTVVGGATPSTKKSENYENGQIAWITPKDLSSFSGRYIKRGERNITEIGLNSCSAQLLPKNSVLFSSRAPIGYVAIAANEVCTNQGFKSVIPNDNTDTLFLFYLLKYNKDKIEGIGSGTTFKEISGNTMKNIVVNVPTDKEVQKKIATILSALDDKIELNNRINNNLEQQAQAVYYKMFSKVNGEPVELSSIIDVRDGTHDSPKAQATGYYLITSKHLLPCGVDKASANRISKADFDKINERSLVETQDILMSMIGTIGLISYIPYEAVDFAIKNVALFKTSHTPELTYYFLCYLKSEKTLQHIEKCLAGSTQKYISLGELRKMPIYSPTTDEIREFNYLVKPMFEEIVSRTYENALLAEMRDTLLPKLMSGEIDVSDLDL